MKANSTQQTARPSIRALLLVAGSCPSDEAIER